jgi:hypothetical protein
MKGMVNNPEKRVITMLFLFKQDFDLIENEVFA